MLKSLGDKDMHVAVRRSHLTTHLIPLPVYAPRRIKSPCMLKSLGDKDIYAAVCRSHLTTRLVPLPGYATRQEDSLIPWLPDIRRAFSEQALHLFLCDKAFATLGLCDDL
jgi:hypothetical protein